MFVPKLSVCVLALSSLPACPLLEVEAEVPEVCLTYPGVKVAGASAEGSMSTTFVVDDLAPIHELIALNAHLEFVRAEARITSGTDSFAFVERAALTIASGDPSSTLPTLTLHECAGDCLSDGPRLALTGNVQRDLVEYARGQSVVIGVDLAGEAPAQDWTMDVAVCMKARTSYRVEITR